MVSADDQGLQMEALNSIREELDRRTKDIQQSTDFMIAALRGQSKAMLTEMPPAVQKLTMREFCHIYGADAAVYLQQQVKRRMQQAISDKQQQKQHQQPPPPPPLASLAQQQQQQHGDTDEPAAAPPPPQHDHVAAHRPDGQPLAEDAHNEPAKNDKDDPAPLGPLFLHVERPNHPRVGFQLDPQQTVEQLGEFAISIPRETIAQMSRQQRERIRDQIQDIQHKLESAKALFNDA